MKAIEKLPQSTITCLDGDDIMAIINKLSRQEEQLKKTLHSKLFEIDTWLQALQATSVEEITEIMENLPLISEFTLKETKLIQDYSKASKEINALSYFGICEGYEIDEGETVLRFTAPKPSKSTTTFLICLSTLPNHVYSVKSHNLPDVIPVSKLEEKYMLEEVGTNDVLKKFTTALYQYLWPLFERERQAKLMEKNSVYYNSSFTRLSVIFYTAMARPYEFLLNYDPLDILPNSVKVECMGTTPSTERLEEVMENLALEMKAKPFLEVMKSYQENEKQAFEEKAGVRGSDSDTSTASTSLFEMF